MMAMDLMASIFSPFQKIQREISGLVLLMGYTNTMASPVIAFQQKMV